MCGACHAQYGGIDAEMEVGRELTQYKIVAYWVNTRIRNKMSNDFNTEFINSQLNNVVGFDLNDLLSIEPFKDNYSTAWFVIFMTFIAAFLLMIGIAFLYSVCDCLCSCCCCRRSDGGNGRKNKVQSGQDNYSMEEIK
ncbi:unnamed protein product [Clavelina lepadiformis]|uniref:Uncharacterized protein n=1 Tax=Clavelina lepadiformis TaxID=159417 RepID=A0ABP0FYD0_CLALP